MKKTITIILLALLVCIVLADPGDVIITIKIPAAKVAEFRAGFLREHPVPIIPDPAYILDVNDPNDFVPWINKYTDKQWFKKVILRYINTEVKNGNDKIAKETANNDSNIAE